MRDLPDPNSFTDPVISERHFQRLVIELAKRNGWLVFHPLTSQKRGAWSTYQSGHKGFPDLVLCHPDRHTLFVELKTQKGKVSKEQQRWADALYQAGSVYRLWRPLDWPAIKQHLANPDQPS